MTGIPRRTLIETALLAPAACALAACAGTGGTSGSGTSEDPEKLTFVLDYTPNTNHTGIYVAMEKGWYRERGIRSE